MQIIEFTHESRATTRENVNNCAEMLYGGVGEEAMN